MPTVAIPDYEDLVNWARTGANGHPIYPVEQDPEREVEYHRLQLEYLLFQELTTNPRLNPPAFASFIYRQPPILDIGGEFPRGYWPASSALSVNHQGYIAPWGPTTPDVYGSITNLPFATGSIPAIICTETLEHVPNLFRAVAELKRILAPGGAIYLSTPFLWPNHANEHFPDFWRLTPDAYRYLFQDMQIEIHQTYFRWESARHHLTQVALLEVMGGGYEPDRFPTGLFVVARHPQPA